MDCKELKPVNSKGNQPWIFIGRTDAEAEAPVLRPPDAKSQLIGKDPDAGKDWRQEEKGSRECFSPWGLQKVRHDYMTKEQKISKNRMLVRVAECCFHYIPDACP